MLFRNYFAELLVKSKLTNAELANLISKKSGKNIDESHISKWLRGRQYPSKENLHYIAEVFEIRFSNIWGMIQVEKNIRVKYSKFAKYLNEDLDLFQIIDTDSKQLIRIERKTDKNANCMRIFYKNISDINWILSFDHSIYPTKYPVTNKILQKWLKAEDKLSFVLKKRNEIKAYCVAIPVNDIAFEEILKGKKEEADLSADDINIKFRNYYIYSNMACSPYYAGCMLSHIAILFNKYKMNRIGGLVVTKEEDRLCKKLKLTKVWVDNEFPSKFKPTTYLGEYGKHVEFTLLIKQFDRFLDLLNNNQ